MTDKSTVETVAIIGAGIGGLYLIAELGMDGFKLRLHDIDDSRLLEIRARVAEWKSRAREAALLRLSAQQAISELPSMAPVSSSL